MTDEGRTYTSLVAITAWKQAASARYAYTATPFSLDERDRAQIVRAHVAGDFPGSPVDLQYHFRLAGGLVESLEITA